MARPGRARQRRRALWLCPAELRVAVVGTHDLLDNRQAETGAGAVAAARSKERTDACLVHCRNARSVVDGPQFPVGPSARDPDMQERRHPVGQGVREHISALCTPGRACGWRVATASRSFLRAPGAGQVGLLQRQGAGALLHHRMADQLVDQLDEVPCEFAQARLVKSAGVADHVPHRGPVPREPVNEVIQRRHRW